MERADPEHPVHTPPIMKRSAWIALAIALATTFWLLSGQLGRGEREPAAPPTVETAAASARPVRVRRIEAAPVVREVLVHGNTAPARTATLRAETAGRVVAVEVPRGSVVEAGQVLIRLDEADRPARLREAEALVAQREIEYRGAQSLERKGLNAETQMAASRALLESARAQREAIRTDLGRTRIRAPFRGILEERTVEVGDALGVNDPAATVVELDPLIITGQVSEREVGLLETGSPGRARLIDGTEFEGRLRYIAATADPATRTFTVELEAGNPGHRALAGTTAELRIPVRTEKAHRLSSALLALDDDGRLGVKTVDDGGVVHFHPVDIVRSDAESLWVAGLPDPARIITVGQGFVRDGDRVEAVAE
ncbi:efflux RND transporter periplasmic adaptor subunit [Thioalbus denitrificans]|nr:efflux RND transporter periplasmic adaptor subunit [Thioalbus denitrificans]